MFNVLQARGVPSKFVMFPDENHVSYDNWKFYLEWCVLRLTQLNSGF